MSFEKNGKRYYTALDLQKEWNLSKATAYRKFDMLFSDVIKEKTRVGSSKKPIKGVPSDIFEARVPSVSQREIQLADLDEYEEYIHKTMENYTKRELAERIAQLTDDLGQAEMRIKELNGEIPYPFKGATFSN